MRIHPTILSDSLQTNLILLGVVVLLIVLGTVGWGLYVVRLNESRKIINCHSFSSYDEVVAFLAKNPTYKNKLDRNDNGIPCETLYKMR